MSPQSLLRVKRELPKRQPFCLASSAMAAIHASIRRHDQSVPSHLAVSNLDKSPMFGSWPDPVPPAEMPSQRMPPISISLQAACRICASLAARLPAELRSASPDFRCTASIASATPHPLTKLTSAPSPTSSACWRHKRRPRRPVRGRHRHHRQLAPQIPCVQEGRAGGPRRRRRRPLATAEGQGLHPYRCEGPGDRRRGAGGRLQLPSVVGPRSSGR
jgi:hypothetical protein